ncbi:MAG: helix-turn-helix transcriptional regulator [Aeromonadaceae bacterium]
MTQKFIDIRAGSGINFSGRTLLNIKKFKLNQCAIIYAEWCDIKITSASQEVVHISKGELFFLERGILVDIQVSAHKGAERPEYLYLVIFIDSDMLLLLRELFDPITPKGWASLAVDKTSSTPLGGGKRTLHNRLIKIKKTTVTHTLFSFLYDSKEEGRHLAYSYAALLSHVDSVNEVAMAIFMSGVTTFTDKVSAVIETNLALRWRLADIADRMFLTEVTIRKRLDAESTSFNKLVLDIKMRYAAKKILSEGANISRIASLVGIVSVSYFIKQFKLYFGVTPKQFYLNMSGRDVQM